MWVSIHPSIEQNNRLASAWQEFNEHQNINASNGIKAATPDFINLNEADSATLVSLKGIGPVTAHNIITRRAKKGSFTDISQLREVGGFSDSTFAVLKRLLIIEARSSNR